MTLIINTHTVDHNYSIILGLLYNIDHIPIISAFFWDFCPFCTTSPGQHSFGPQSGMRQDHRGRLRGLNQQQGYSHQG